MLILTRRPGERVVIGDEILVTVMGVSGHTVRLGIAAPEGVPIYREEIWLAVKEENRGVAGNPVPRGLAAPEGVPTSREELWWAVREENRPAAEAPPDALPADAPT